MTTIDQLWEGLIALRDRLKDSPVNVIACSYHAGQFKLYTELHKLHLTESSAIILSKDVDDIALGSEWHVHKLPFDNCIMYVTDTLDPEVSKFLSLYWPLCLMDLFTQEVPFVLLHMACSIDGKVATIDGDSKWIGNDENLIHAHRLRALVDSIMVGAKTVLTDNPTLTVRLVKGNNPIRLILSNHTEDFESLTITPKAKTYLLRDKEYDNIANHSAFTKVLYYDGSDEAEKIVHLLDQLKDEGIKSILIEGGPQTASTFLRNKSIDIVQFHMAPLILGSGKSCINLNNINSIGDGQSLTNHVWHSIGDTQMITARPA